MNDNAYGGLIACQGFYYSGSSSLIGLFSEFDNVSVMGYPDRIYSASNVSFGTEVCFFKSSGIFDYIDAFFSESVVIQDIAIKRFIKNIYASFRNKFFFGYDKNPLLYDEQYLSKSISFILKTINIDTDLAVQVSLTDDSFSLPVVIYNDSRFDNSSLVHGVGTQKYLLYSFKKIKQEIFTQLVSDYLSSFFDSVEKKEFLVVDQLLGAYLDQYNKYSNSPAMQICVYRDPRDQFVSAFRHDLDLMPRDSNRYADFYKNHFKLEYFLSSYNPYRLMIRFEDLVLKYDETVEKVLDFCGISRRHHVRPQTVFKPSISAINIGGYKDFFDQNLMHEIEKALPEYCFYPDRENLSADALELLNRKNV